MHIDGGTADVCRPNGLIRAALFALTLLCAPAAQAGGDAPYPVWWSPELGLESLDDIEWKLEESFHRMSWYEVVTHDVQSVDTDELIDENKPEWGYYQELVDINIERRTIKDCKSLIKFRNMGFDVYDESPNLNREYFLNAFYSGYCYSLSALKNAKPSKKSFIRNFSFDEDGVDYIPPMIRLGWRCRGLPEFTRANRDGVSWREFSQEYFSKGSPYYIFSIIGQKSISIDNSFGGSFSTLANLSHRVRIIITGQGDFNGDGLEDFSIRREFAKPFDNEIITLSTSHYIVTRMATDSLFRVIDYLGPPPLLETVDTCDARKRIIESGRAE